MRSAAAAQCKPRTVSVDTVAINKYLSEPQLIVAESLKRNLHAYTKAMWHVAEPGREFQDNWHIAAICEVLEAATRFELKNVVINIPFRCMKSLLHNVSWPSWVWAKHPERRWLCVSHKEDLAVRDSVKCRRVIESAWYQGMFGHVYMLTSDQNAKSRYENNKTGYRMTGSVGGSVIGEGGDYRVLDDPHKTDISESAEVREGKLTWLREEFSSRFIDPKLNAQVTIMQRLNDRDMSGFLLAEKMADYHLCIPMRFEEQRKVYSLNAAAPFVPTIEDPRSKEGELMWPTRFDEAAVIAMEYKLGDYGTAGQLQQRPSPRGGGIIKREKFRFYRRAERPAMELFDFIALSTDAAFKDTASSSYVVTQAWGRKGVRNYLLEQVRERLSFTATVSCILNMRERVPAHVTLIEDKANGPAIIDTIREKIPGLIPVEPQGSKVARAEAAAPLIDAGCVWLPDPTEDADAAIEYAWVELFIAEWCAVPNNAFWDQVDASDQYLNKYGRTLTFEASDVMIGGTLVSAGAYFSNQSSTHFDVDSDDDNDDVVTLGSATEYLGGVR